MGVDTCIACCACQLFPFFVRNVLVFVLGDVLYWMYFLESPKSTRYMIWAFLPTPIKKLSGFMSRWRMCFSCTSYIRSTICSPICSTVFRDRRLPLSLNRSSKLDPKRSMSMMLYWPSVVKEWALVNDEIPWEFPQLDQKNSGTCTSWLRGKVVGICWEFTKVLRHSVRWDWFYFRRDKFLQRLQCPAF